MIDVALCFTDTSGGYHKRALVTALSVLDNTRTPMRLHVVHDETLPDEAKSSFRAICSQYGQELCLHHAGDVPPDAAANVPAFLTKGALYRTMLPRLIPADKLLYLDCDIVCLSDVNTIFSFDISNHYFGAVKMASLQGEKWAKKLNLSSSFCINSGLLLMNLDKIRTHFPDFTSKLFTICGNFPIKIGDQGAINILFDNVPDAYFFLPEWCNLRTEQLDYSSWPLSDYYGNVIHFAGKKPWEVWTLPALFYWKYHARLFPSDDVFTMIEKLAPYEHAYLYSYILRDDKKKKRLRRMYELEGKGLWGRIRELLF